LATDSIAITQPNLPAPKSTVAGATRTIILLAVIASWGAWGYFGTQDRPIASSVLHPPQET